MIPLKFGSNDAYAPSESNPPLDEMTAPTTEEIAALDNLDDAGMAAFIAEMAANLDGLVFEPVPGADHRAPAHRSLPLDAPPPSGAAAAVAWGRPPPPPPPPPPAAMAPSSGSRWQENPVALNSPPSLTPFFDVPRDAVYTGSAPVPAHVAANLPQNAPFNVSIIVYDLYLNECGTQSVPAFMLAARGAFVLISPQLYKMLNMHPTKSVFIPHGLAFERWDAAVARGQPVAPGTHVVAYASKLRPTCVAPPPPGRAGPWRVVAPSDASKYQLHIIELDHLQVDPARPSRGMLPGDSFVAGVVGVAGPGGEPAPSFPAFTARMNYKKSKTKTMPMQYYASRCKLVFDAAAIVPGDFVAVELMQPASINQPKLTIYVAHQVGVPRPPPAKVAPPPPVVPTPLEAGTADWYTVFRRTAHSHVEGVFIHNKADFPDNTDCIIALADTPGSRPALASSSVWAKSRSSTDRGYARCYLTSSAAADFIRVLPDDRYVLVHIATARAAGLPLPEIPDERAVWLLLYQHVVQGERPPPPPTKVAANVPNPGDINRHTAWRMADQADLPPGAAPWYPVIVRSSDGISTSSYRGLVPTSRVADDVQNVTVHVLKSDGRTLVGVPATLRKAKRRAFRTLTSQGVKNHYTVRPGDRLTLQPADAARAAGLAVPEGSLGVVHHRRGGGVDPGPKPKKKKTPEKTLKKKAAAPPGAPKAKRG